VRNRTRTTAYDVLLRDVLAPNFRTLDHTAGGGSAADPPYRLCWRLVQRGGVPRHFVGSARRARALHPATNASQDHRPLRRCELDYSGAALPWGKQWVTLAPRLLTASPVSGRPILLRMAAAAAGMPGAGTLIAAGRYRQQQSTSNRGCVCGSGVSTLTSGKNGHHISVVASYWPAPKLDRRRC
jgi:hypothetical protein